MTDKTEGTKVSFEVDLKNQIIIGNSDGNTFPEQDIARKIAESVSRALDNLYVNWINYFEEKIENKDYEAAYEIFYKNRGTLQFTTKKEPLEILRKMNLSMICKEHKKEYLTFLIAYSAHIGDSDQSLNDIDDLLSEYSKELDPILVQNLLLEKANIAARNGLINTASLIYKQVISSSDSDAGTTAWAYQGLSIIAETTQDQISYAEKASDKHLESGSRNEAVKNLIKISDIKSAKYPAEALQLIDKCISLYESDKLIDRELLASLKHKKSAYLQRIGRSNDALQFSEESCDLRRGLIGNEIAFYSSLSLAKILAEENSLEDKAETYKLESEVISSIIEDRNFLLRRELSELISRSEMIDDDLLSRIMSSSDSDLVSSSLLYQSTNSALSLEESIELLDKSRIELESKKDNSLLDAVYFAIAEKYRIEGLTDEAYEYYIKSLEINQFYHSATQNCVAMLFGESRWKQAQDFIKGRMELTGELPGICFAYAKCLFENNNYQLALKYFKKSDPSINGIDAYISTCLRNLNDSEIDFSERSNEPQEKTVTAEQFYKALEEFSTSISADSRMHFWNKDKASGEYKWTQNPEELSKQMLITFLNGKFGKGAIEVLQETRAGAGFIDLYVLLPGGLRIVIELKMCGSGYSSTYALSGESQIIHYQINKSTKLGYLVVFDARKIDYGKHFKKLQMINDHAIYTIAIDMRPEIKK